MNRFMTNLRSLQTSENIQATSVSTRQYSLSLPNFRRPISSSFLGNIGEPLNHGWPAVNAAIDDLWDRVSDEGALEVIRDVEHSATGNPSPNAICVEPR